MVLRRDKPGHAAGAAARDDGHFVYRIAIRQHMADDSVAGFVVGGQFFLLFVHHLTLALRPDGNALECFGNVLFANLRMAAPGGDNGRLVRHVRQIGAR